MPVADPSLPLQKAICSHLSANSIPIYDGVPPNTAKPYVSFGPFDVLPDVGRCLDGAQVVIQIDVWTAELYGATRQCKQISAAIAALLDEADLVLDAPHVLLGMTVDPIRYLRDPGGAIAHGVLTVNAWCEPRD